MDNTDKVINTKLEPETYFAIVNGAPGNTYYDLQFSATSLVESAGNDFKAAKDIDNLTNFNQTEWVGSFDEDDFYRFMLPTKSTVDLSLTI